MLSCDRPGFASIEQGAAAAGITFEYHFSDGIHDRSITTDTGWTIVLGPGHVALAAAHQQLEQ